MRKQSNSYGLGFCLEQFKPKKNLKRQRGSGTKKNKNKNKITIKNTNLKKKIIYIK